MTAIGQTPGTFSRYFQPILYWGGKSYRILYDRPYISLAFAAISFLSFVFRRQIANLFKNFFAGRISTSLDVLKNKLDEVNPHIPSGIQVRCKDLADFLKANPTTLSQPSVPGSLRTELSAIVYNCLPFVPGIWRAAKEITNSSIASRIRCYENLLLAVHALQCGKFPNNCDNGVDIGLLQHVKGDPVKYCQIASTSGRGRLTLTLFDNSIINLENVSDRDLTLEMTTRWKQWVIKKTSTLNFNRWSEWVENHFSDNNQERKYIHSDLIQKLDISSFRSLVLTIGKFPNLLNRFSASAKTALLIRIRTSEYEFYENEVGRLRTAQFCSLMTFFKQNPDQFAYPPLIMAIIARLRGRDYDLSIHYNQFNDVYDIRKLEQTAKWESYLPQRKNKFTDPAMITPEMVAILPDGIVQKFSQLGEYSFPKMGTWHAIQVRCSSS